MNEEILTQLGLNRTQAKAYLTLVRHGSMSPPELAEATGETRTNAYSVLDQLVELGLATRKEIKKKYQYRVENPVALEKLVKKHRDEALERERTVKNAMPSLLNFFYTYSEQPGVRFFQGKSDIEEIYKDTLRTGKDIMLIRAHGDRDIMSMEFYKQHSEKRAKLGIKTTILSENKAVWDGETNRQLLIDRKMLPKDTYSSPVELMIYGNKVAMISFGEEVMGTIIESPQIATAMGQLYRLISKQCD